MLDPTEHDHEIWLWMPRGYRAWSWRPAFSGWKSWPQIPQVIGPGVLLGPDPERPGRRGSVVAVGKECEGQGLLVAGQFLAGEMRVSE